MRGYGGRTARRGGRERPNEPVEIEVRTDAQLGRKPVPVSAVGVFVGEALSTQALGVARVSARAVEGTVVTKRAKNALTRRKPSVVLRLKLNARGRKLFAQSGVVKVHVFVRVGRGNAKALFKVLREWRR